MFFKVSTERGLSEGKGGEGGANLHSNASRIEKRKIKRRKSLTIPPRANHTWIFFFSNRWIIQAQEFVDIFNLIYFLLFFLFFIEKFDFPRKCGGANRKSGNASHGDRAVAPVVVFSFRTLFIVIVLCFFIFVVWIINEREKDGDPILRWQEKKK